MLFAKVADTRAMVRVILLIVEGYLFLQTSCLSCRVISGQ